MKKRVAPPPPAQEAGPQPGSGRPRLPIGVAKWFAGILAAVMIAYFGALATNLGRPTLEFADTDIPKSFTRKSVMKEGALHGVLVIEPLIRNSSLFPGNVERADVVPLNPTTKNTTLTVNFIDKQRLYWRDARRIQIRMVSAIPLSDATTTDDPEFRLQLYDNLGQQIGPEPYNIKVESRRR